MSQDNTFPETPKFQRKLRVRASLAKHHEFLSLFLVYKAAVQEAVRGSGGLKGTGPKREFARRRFCEAFSENGTNIFVAPLKSLSDQLGLDREYLESEGWVRSNLGPS